jgi:hypothetical protein
MELAAEVQERVDELRTGLSNWVSWAHARGLSLEVVLGELQDQIDQLRADAQGEGAFNVWWEAWCERKGYPFPGPSRRGLN